MLNRKKSNEEDEPKIHYQSMDEETTDTPVMSVECPVHGEGHMLQVQTEQKFDERTKKTVFIRFADCTCTVPDNKYLGKRVWEQTQEQ